MDLAQLRRSRASRKNSINKILGDLKQDVIDKNVIAIENSLALLITKEEVLIEVLKKLEVLTPVAELDAEIDENEKILDSIVIAKVEANRSLVQIKQAIGGVATTVAGSGSSAISATKNQVKLPKLQISKFEGSIVDWTRFIDQFKVGVHANASLAPVDKFNYLKSLLTSEAAKTIQGITLTDANYQIALDLLESRYGRKEVLITEHVNCLLRMPCVKMSKDGRDLRRLYEDLLYHIRTLESLGTDVAIMSTMVCPIILQALPTFILSEWNRKPASKAAPDVKELMDFIQVELENVEQVYRVASLKNGGSKNEKGSTDKKVPNEETSASALMSTNTKDIGDKSNFCVFCENKLHRSIRCSEYVTAKERLEALRKNRRCFKCMSNRHFSSACSKEVFCRKCKKPHNFLLCFKKDYQPKANEETTEVEKEKVKSMVASASCHAHGKKGTENNLSILQVMRVWLQVEGRKEPANLLIDGGSEKSFVSSAVVKKHKLATSQVENLTVHSFGGIKKTHQTKRIPLTLVGANNISLDIEALEVPNICDGVTLWESSRIENFLQSKRTREWSQLMGKGEMVTIDILIGADYFWRIMTAHMKRLSPFLMATQTIFGWLLQGSTKALSCQTSIISMFVSTSETELEALWELDRSGMMSLEEKSELRLEDVLVQQEFEASTKYLDNRYQVRIPWNQDKEELCVNYSMAKERLRRLILKLQKDPLILERYRQGMNEYLKNGHVEEVDPNEDTGDSCYYMPHHPVIKEERKTTKLRIVFDASSHSHAGKSLNDCQYTGPNLNPSIFGLILRFRWHKVSMTSDIEKAFLQVVLAPEDRNATRFLWTEEEWNDQKEPPLKILRSVRVLFGMRASPYLLAATIRFHTKNHVEATAELRSLIDEQTYVDDMLGGNSSTQAAFEDSKNIYNFMKKGGFLMRKWTTNCSELRKQWIQEGLASEEEPVELLKILGLIWDPSNDTLSIRKQAILEKMVSSKDTKRGILELMAMLFDPLGLLAPKIIQAKCLLQDLWRKKVSWDQDIPEDLKKQWWDWKKDLATLESFTVERWYGTTDTEDQEIEIHIFCDATLKAYGSVAYLRLQSGEIVRVVLLAAKSRVAPLQLLSIPRLELMAALIGARLAKTLKEVWHMKRMSVFLWSDSKVVLDWLRSIPSKWKLFVGRRIQEIQDLTAEDVWLYCPTKDNPADIISRGASLVKLESSELWWQGPKWLRYGKDKWPSIQQELVVAQEEISEEEEILVAFTTTEEVPLFDVDRYSTWKRMLQVTGWIKRFIDKCRKCSKANTPYLTGQELEEAQDYWLKISQASSFPQEIRNLQQTKQVDKKSKIFQFHPFLDEKGLLRLQGRLKLAELNEDVKCPLLLAYNSLVCKFILEQHNRTIHGGVQDTLGEVRLKCWILKGRQSVRKAIKNCMVCRKWGAKPIQVIEAQLPRARITMSQAFSSVGLDFCGPVLVKGQGQKYKCYVCLFTCAVTRAVHLEVVTSQSIQALLLAFRRFIARRGIPKLIFSDNAKSFQQLDHMLREAWQNVKSTKMQNFVAQLRIEWRFIAPLAAWWGGFYEAMVGGVKRHLRRALNSALVDLEELITILTEIESVINNRPLTALTEDSADGDCLTPAHFLLGKYGGSLSDILPDVTSEVKKGTLNKRWNLRKRLIKGFWSRWSKEYLLQLKSAHTVKSYAEDTALKMGDVVLLQEEKLPRGRWKMARIVELTSGRDGKIRSAMLKCPDGNLIRRAVQKICPLEII